MPFDIRSTALSASVLTFFVTCVIGAFCRHAPFTSCKRAAIAMIVTYFVIAIVVRILNAVVVDAMISKQVDKRLGRTRSNEGAHAG